MTDNELLDHIERRIESAQTAVPFPYNDVARLLTLAGDPRAKLYRGGAHQATLSVKDAKPLIQKARARVEFVEACCAGAPLHQRLLLLARTYDNDDDLKDCVIACAARAKEMRSQG